MIPIRDENPTVRTPVAMPVLVGLNVLAWMFVQGLGSSAALARSICTLGLIPGELLGLAAPGTQVPLGENLVCVLGGGPVLYGPLTSMFLHGSWIHIIANMWFLWVFGDNVEDAMGPVRFVFFYLLCGLAAALAQVATDPDSVVPMVGASGAIGGVMGGYARLYPHAHVHTLVFLGFYATSVAVPAVYMLGYWFLLQFLSGLPALGGATGGVAFWAHVGGFLCGLFLVALFQRPDYVAEHKRQHQRHDARYRW
jgi:membrane associated rhomboid family serine protease